MFPGWWIVISGAIIFAYTSGTFWQGFGAFFDPIVIHFGWSRAITSGVISIQRTESGMISPFVGFFINKFGPRNVMLIGIIITGFGFIFLSKINSIISFYISFALISLGVSFGTWIVINTSITNWFNKKRSKALAFSSAGSAFGGLFVPIIIWLINVTDWRTSLLIIGIGFWIIGIPAAFFMKSNPEDYGLMPDGKKDTDKLDKLNASYKEYSLYEALTSRLFWQMSFAFGIGQLVLSASVNQIPAISSFGYSREFAGITMVIISITSLLGRLGGGILGDKFNKIYLISVAFALQFISTIIFVYATNKFYLIIFALLWGLGFGSSIPMRFAIIADFFGRKNFGTIMGISMTINAIVGIAGPVFVGWMFDINQNYQTPYLILSTSLLCAIPLTLNLKAK